MLDTVLKPDILRLVGGPRLGVEASGLLGGASMNDRGARTVPPHAPRLARAMLARFSSTAHEALTPADDDPAGHDF